MTDIPFNEGTKIYQIFNTLSDSEWHCAKHELPGTQPAKAIQIIRQNGYEVENKTVYCSVCSDKTVHRRLKSTTASAPSVVRLQISPKFRQRVLKLYKNIEAITLRKIEPNMLEVDHRFPQVRWSQPEAYDVDMSDQEIYDRFQLLTRENNLWKSRKCEHCKATRERGTFIEIEFFAEGGPLWDANIADDDERGCHGCFWYTPDVWRKALNELINEQKHS